MLQTLELRHVRSYENGLFDFEPGVNIIVGPNASGKTNLLEAISMITTGASFRSSDGDMIAHGASWARIDALLDGVERSVKLRGGSGAKSYLLDGVEKKRVSEAFTYPTVLFEPYDILLLGGEPERRRTYIDRLLSQLDATYRLSLQSYKRALAQRNRLLKEPTCTPSDAFVWDMQLCEYATTIVAARLKYVIENADLLTSLYQEISGGADVLRVAYESRIHAENYSSSLLKTLAQSFERDRLRGFTGAGPHRDDLQISINDHDVRTDASRGETRSTVLSLKVAEMRACEQVFGKKPLLLLDDVFSELDGRRRRLLAHLLQDSQTFITTTDADVAIEHFGTLAHIIPLEGEGRRG